MKLIFSYGSIVFVVKDWLLFLRFFADNRALYFVARCGCIKDKGDGLNCRGFVVFPITKPGKVTGLTTRPQNFVIEMAEHFLEVPPLFNSIATS
jgi:hypothetical protein